MSQNTGRSDTCTDIYDSPYSIPAKTLENHACMLCGEVVRAKGVWVKDVVFWNAAKGQIICLDCADRVAQLSEGARIGLYVGPGRERV